MRRWLSYTNHIQAGLIPLALLYVLPWADRRIVVGVAIFSSFPESPRKKLLLLRRAASEDAFPNMFEIPGGHAEDVDETLLSTVVRETLEETGLVVKHIVDEFEGFEYHSGNGLTIQINFVVEVDENDALVVKMNPEEHQAFAWVEKGEDLDKYQLTDNMRKVVMDALMHA